MVSYFHIFAAKTITYSKLQFCILLLMNIVQQDACTSVHSACQRDENGRNMDICVLLLRQGQMQKFFGLKGGGES